MLTWEADGPRLQQLRVDLQHLPGHLVRQVSCGGRLPFTLRTQQFSKHVWELAGVVSLEAAAVCVNTL